MEALYRWNWAHIHLGVPQIPAYLAKVSQQCLLVSTAAADDAEALLQQRYAQHNLVQRKRHPAKQAHTVDISKQTGTLSGGVL
jgi:hypothetical protein